MFFQLSTTLVILFHLKVRFFLVTVKLHNQKKKIKTEFSVFMATQLFVAKIGIKCTGGHI